MRAVTKSNDDDFTDRRLAELAGSGVNAGLDSYSEYSVGAAVEMKYAADEHISTHVYCGSNINLSGMQSKVHAEQLALFQAILDIEEKGMEDYAELQSVMVITSEDDLALKCGHCLQVFAGACEHYGWDMGEVGYNAARGQTLYDDRGNPDGVHYEFDKYTLRELIGDTYVNRRASDE